MVVALGRGAQGEAHGGVEAGPRNRYSGGSCARRARGVRGPATFHPIIGGAHEKIRAGAGRPAGRNRGRGGGSPADGGAAEGGGGQERPERLDSRGGGRSR